MMGGLSPLHWIIIIGLVALVFGGGGKLSGLMGDAAKGIKAFRDGLKDESGGSADKPAEISAPAPKREDAKNAGLADDLAEIPTPKPRREEANT